MPQARDEAGNIWNVDEQGNVIGLAQPAPRTGQVFTLPQNPKEARAEDRADAAAERQARADERAAAKADREAREWAATHNPDGSAKARAQAKALPDGAAKRYEEAINAFAALDRAANAFNDDFGGNTLTGGAENTLQNLYAGFGTPGQAQWWSDFQATDNVLRNALYGASLTAGEKQAYERTTVSPRMDPAQIRANLERRKQLARDVLSRRTAFLKANGYDAEAVDALAGEYGPLINGATQRAENEAPNQDNGAPLKPGTAPVDPGSLPPANGAGGSNPPVTPWDQPNPGGGRTVATGSMRTIHSDRLSAQVDAMMNAGASKAMIDTVLKQQGFPPIDPSTYAAAKKWMQENPDKKYFGASIDRQEPNSLLAQVAGSAPGSFVAQMADAATAGTVGALAGDKGRGALEAMEQINPNASLAGQITGNITGVGAAEAAIGSRAPAALAKYAPRIADALFGGISGANRAQPGEGLQDAAIGAAGSALGGAVGERVVKSAGGLLKGVTNPAASYLRQQGVPLTVGQAMGGFAKNVEDRATSLPLVGDIINRRRQEGLEGFNRAAFREALEPIGTTVNKVGEQGVDEALEEIGDAYNNALGGVSLNVDPQYKIDIGRVVRSANRMPEGLRDQFHATLGERVGQMFNGQQIDGKGLQAALKGLKMDASSLTRRSEPMADVFASRADEAGEALMDMAERQAPGTIDDLAAANQAYRRVGVLGDANLSAPSQPYFTPAQLDRAATTNTRKFGGRNAAARGDRPFYELATAGKEILPNSIPNSGTADRLLNAAMLGGVGTVAGAGAGYAAGDTGAGTATGLGLTLAAMLGGSRGAQSAATKALLDRPEFAIRLGDELLSKSRVGGWTGAGALTPLLIGQ